MAGPWHSDPPAACSTSASPPFAILPLQGASISCCAATSCSHLPWLIVASTSLPPASPSPVLRCHDSFFLCPFFPLSAPDDCHIAASCCAITSCQLGSDVRRRQQQHCVIVVVAHASNSASASHSCPPQPVVALPPVRLGLHNSTILWPPPVFDAPLNGWLLRPPPTPLAATHFPSPTTRQSSTLLLLAVARTHCQSLADTQHQLKDGYNAIADQDQGQ